MNRRITIRRLALALLIACSAPSMVNASQEAVIKDAIARIAPSVVQIQTSGGRERIGRMIIGTGPTTGLVVSEDGYILSSAFNFIQDPASIVVRLQDGTKKAAKMVARDRSRMLVMLKIEVDKPLTVPTPIPHDEMRVGQWAVAVGRTYEADSPNVSIGILSALNRVWSKAVQTDAKISPSNYGGPLIDIQGRVYGILVPLSPQQQTEVAGAEWYDSGIGFAIPLIDLQNPIEQMKSGEDLYRGILGVTLKGSNMFSDPAVVAVSVRNSPADKAGIKPKDRIIQIDGRSISRQTHLKHALGPKYAGETVKVVALRKGKRLEFDVELAARVDPYERPYLGILPTDADDDGEDDADDDDGGVLVRYVLPESPALEAGLLVGDRIVSVDEESVSNGEVLRELLANREPGQSIELAIVRDGDERAVKVVLANEPDSVPDELPVRKSVGDDANDEGVAKAKDGVDSDDSDEDSTNEAKVVTVKAAAESNKCFALIPPTYNESQPHGVIVWLSAPSSFDEELFAERWSEIASRHHLIVLAPQPNDEQRWLVTESPVIAKLFKQLDRDYAIDSHRVVVHGYQGGASLAYRFAFENRDIIHGVAAVDAAVPVGVQPRGNDSIEHMSFWIHAAKDSRRSERVTKNVERFRAMKFPVTDHLIEGKARYLDANELNELGRWVDVQDRI